MVIIRRVFFSHVKEIPPPNTEAPIGRGFAWRFGPKSYSSFPARKATGGAVFAKLVVTGLERWPGERPGKVEVRLETDGK